MLSSCSYWHFAFFTDCCLRAQQQHCAPSVSAWESRALRIEIVRIDVLLRCGAVLEIYDKEFNNPDRKGYRTARSGAARMMRSAQETREEDSGGGKGRGHCEARNETAGPFGENAGD